MSIYEKYKDMKAISVWQPWAWLEVHGHKPIETRTWRPPAKLIGKRIAIHASMKPAPVPVFRHVDAFAARRGFAFPGKAGLVYGCLVGSARLVGVEEYPDEESFFRAGLGHLCTDRELFEPVRYGWVFEDPEAEESPIARRGAQGFFPALDPRCPS